MSEVIVRMEMPRNCQECPLSHALYLHGSMYCGANGISYGKEHYKLKRPERCPIVGELPEQHGDLIDRDEVKNEMLKRMPKLCMTASGDNPVVCTRREMLYSISRAKAVIAAERSET